MTKRLVPMVLVLLVVAATGCMFNCPEHNRTLTATIGTDYVLAGERSFLTGWPATNPDGTVNVVVEIPAGTNAKWEVTKPDGKIEWEFKEGKPRVVKYLAYPGNYGMIPQTLLPKEMGGDGDPLDVIVLGSSVARGRVVQARLLGILKLMDSGEQDDKLIAVLPGSPLSTALDLEQLTQRFPGVTSIIETWFVNYKGPGEMTSKGFGDRSEAAAILNAARQQFNAQRR